MKPNMKDIIKHLSHGKDPITAWNNALQDDQNRNVLERARRHNLAKKIKGRVPKLSTDLPIGTKVRMVNCYEAECSENQHVWVTRSEPWQLGHGDWVVSLEGKSGGFDLTCLELAEG